MYTYLRQSRDLRRENYLYLCRNRHWLRRTRKSFKNPANSIRHAMHLESFFFIFHFNILIRLNKTRELPIYFLCILFSSFIIFLQNLFCNLRTIYCNFTIVFSEVTKKKLNFELKHWTIRLVADFGIKKERAYVQFRQAAFLSVFKSICKTNFLCNFEFSIQKQI